MYIYSTYEITSSPCSISFYVRTGNTYKQNIIHCSHVDLTCLVESKVNNGRHLPPLFPLNVSVSELTCLIAPIQ